MNTKKKKKKKKEAVGRLLYSRINTVTPARRVGAAEGSSSLFLPFPPCVTKATETTSSGVNIQRSKKKKKRKKMFFLFFFLFFLTYLCIDCDMKTMFAETSGANIHMTLTLVGGQNRK